MKGIRIENLDHLKTLIGEDGGDIEVVLALNGGAFSRRTLMWYGYEDPRWSVYHGISDAWEDYEDDDQLREFDPHIFEGIEKGALWTAST